jgi:hypothetical protein
VAQALLLWSCVVIFGLVGLVALQLLVVHRLATARRRRERECEDRWIPILAAAMEQVPDSLPPLNEPDLPCVLSLWNRLHDSISTPPGGPLHQLALQAGLDRAARRLFRSPAAHEVLLAVATLGRLRDRSMWTSIVGLARGGDLLLSVAAARALVRIDPTDAMPLLLPLVAERDDWPQATVVLMLQEAGSDAISQPLADAILGAAPEHDHRLIRHLDLAHADVTTPLLTLLIRQVTRVDSITACLRVFRDANDLGAVRPFLNHSRWEVRVRAVDAIGRLGTARESARLIPMLSDSEWWVRYRAAQALCTLLAGDLDRVRRIRTTHGDPFARDMLAHVLAERSAA